MPDKQPRQNTGNHPDPLAVVAADTDFAETTIKAVKPKDGDGWEITYEDGWIFFVPDGPVEPKVGMTARRYPGGAGAAVRGLVLDGAIAFYRTAEEDKVYQANERYGSSPEDLLSRWDGGRSVWSIEMGGFGPGYEQALQLCVFEALRALIANNGFGIDLNDHGSGSKLYDAVSKVIDPIVEPLGLSGNQFGAALNLASWFYRDGPVKALETAARERRIQVRKESPTLNPGMKWVRLTGDNYPPPEKMVLLRGPESPVASPPMGDTVNFAIRGTGKVPGWWLGTALTGSRFFADNDRLLGASFWTHYAEVDLPAVDG